MRQPLAIISSTATTLIQCVTRTTRGCTSSLCPPPCRSPWTILQDDAFFQQFAPYVVRGPEILTLPRRLARGDARGDPVAGLSAAQERIGIALQQPQDAAQRPQLRRQLPAAAPDLVRELEEHRTASGVPKSSSIASLKRRACGAFQSTAELPESFNA